MPPPSPGYYSQSTMSLRSLTHDDSFTSLSSSNDDDSESTRSGSPLKQSNSARPKKSISSEKSKLVEKIYPITEVFSVAFLEARRKESVSRANFATVLVRNFFTKEVRMSSNVAGKQGKNQLNRDMMAAIKVATFKMYPLSSSEDEKVAWRQCTKAIDGSGRQLYRTRNPGTKEN